MARITADFDGWFLSPQFPTFRAVPEALYIKYLEWYCRQSKVWDDLRRKSRGIGARRETISPEAFLSLEIPLPPLDEQRRIVAHIEALAAKIEQARGLRRGTLEEAEALLRSLLFYDEGWSPLPTPMSELVALREPDIDVIPIETYQFAGVYSFGRGVFAGETKTGSEFSYKRLTSLHKDDFIYPKLMAWEGAFGTVPASCDGLVVSPEFPVFKVDTDKILPEVLDIYFRTPSIWPIIGSLSTGTNVRRRRLHPSAFLRFIFPLPPIDTQYKLREINGKSIELRDLYSKTYMELDALLPSILDRAFKGEL